MFGDGSDGALNVTSGTTNLPLDTKHQFTTVNIASGATLSTASTTGSVLYILAKDSITINGTINVSNVVNRGQNTWSVTLDGTTYTSPGTGNGGKGGDALNGGLGGVQSDGFGGGGAGGGYSNQFRGGHGGPGGAPGGVGGAAITVNYGGGGIVNANGNNGGMSAGGSGGAGTLSGSRTSGAGGNAYGAAGGAADGNNNSVAGSGGGAGGQAGRPGVHVVLKSPVLIVNGTIITSGTDGQFGGNGGAQPYAADSRGSGGGGGGGGSAGNIYLITNNLTESSATYTMNRGFGFGGGLGYQQGGAGDPGVVGTKTATILSMPYTGPFARVWDGTKWAYAKHTVYSSGKFAQPKIKVTS